MPDNNMPMFDLTQPPEDDGGYSKKDWTKVEVQEFPPCDLCKMEGVEEDAKYDAKMAPRYNGVWAWMCQAHWVECGATTELGLGLGQRLVLEQGKNRT